jgi:hypothetical protein
LPDAAAARLGDWSRRAEAAQIGAFLRAGGGAVVRR